MPKKPNKKTKKAIEDTRKGKVHKVKDTKDLFDNLNKEEFVWDWTEEDDDDVVLYFQRFATHMVDTGLKMIETHDSKAITEQERADILFKIMETEDWQISQEDMDRDLPKEQIKEIMEKYIEHDEEVRILSEKKHFDLSNKLAEVCVYNMLANMEKEGVLKLCWDDKKKDFIYMPVEKDDDGEEWKNRK